MPKQTNSSIYFQYINGNSRVHNGNTYAGSATEPDFAQRNNQQNEATKNNTHERLLRTLSFDQDHTRQQALREPSPNTCNWILHTLEYQAWINPEEYHTHHGFFWIKGKPGAGKSILMNYLRTMSIDTIPDATIISFFFNARGHELERTILGLYRSLLLQLMRIDESLYITFTELGFIDPEPIERHGWQRQSLKNLFSRAVAKIETRKLILCIDALDECPEEEIRDMVLFFQEIGTQAAAQGPALYICFSSRHYPNISIKKSVSLDIEFQNGHRLDLERYIDSTLMIDNSSSIDDIKQQILWKASGVFLWVALVIPMLNKAFDSGRMHALKEQLQKLPSELSHLFSDMLMRDSEDREAMLLCIQLVLFTRLPLSIQELYHAINIGLGNPVAQADPVSEAVMQRYILNSSKGLVEGIFYSWEGPCHMQFIHESVRNFLLCGNELQRFWPQLKNNFVGESQEEIKRVCFKQIQSMIPITGTIRACHPVVQESGRFHSCWRYAAECTDFLEKEFPFFKYAVSNVLFHSNEAESFGVQQLDWIQQFPLADWTTLYNIIRASFRGCSNNYGCYNYHADMYGPDVKMLYVLVHQNLIHLVRQSPDRLHHFRVQGGYYGTPLVAALACGYRWAARYLGLQVFLDQGLNISYGQEEEAFFSELTPDANFQPWGPNTFGYLSYIGCITAMKAMWLQGEDIGKADNEGYTALSYAVSNRSVEAVRWLCSHKNLDPNVVVRYGMTALRYISYDYSNIYGDPLPMKRRFEIFRLLLEHPRIELDAPDEQGRTVFSYIAGDHILDLADMLLRSSLVNPNSTCYLGKTPLHYAAASSKVDARDMVAWLLSIPTIKHDCSDNLDRTPLSYAAESGRLKVVVALLDSKRVHVEQKDKQGRTPLWWAVKRGLDQLFLYEQRRIVTTLLWTGRAKTDSTTVNGGTPLTLAGYILDNPSLSSFNKCGMEFCIKVMERYKCGESIDGDDVWCRIVKTWSKKKSSAI